MRKPCRILFFFIVTFILSALFYCGPRTKPYDLVITNGSIIDGTGNPWFKGDIAIKDEKIVLIGSIEANQAKKTIDAQNLTVCPGFIDIHTHCDRGIGRTPTVDNYIYQGVTTVIGGNCGGHPFPIREHFKKIEENGISINFACLVGHNTIRQEVMGYKMDPPTQEELRKMKSLIEEEMKAGAIGFSTGLSYLPGIYSKTEELVELASAVAPYQ